MDNCYTITIDGKQEATDTTEHVSLSTLGHFSRKGNTFCIEYEESETTGFAGNVTTLVVEDSQRATLRRSGKTNSELVIEPGQKHLCHYDAGEVSFVIGVLADRIQNRLGDRGGELKLRYALDFNSNAVSVNELNITVRENTTNA
ncbi:MAG: DUF1934 domain-containing protein [Oscillospiraceae bacterium]